MKKNKTVLFCFYVFFILIIICSTAYASDATGSNWRKTYDSILLWINFFIFFFVMFKLLKNPLVNFIKGRKEELRNEIKKVEDEKEKILAETKDIVNKLGESTKHFAKVKERIINLGIKEKQKIIDEANTQSSYLLEETNKKIENQLIQAKGKFKDELIEQAFDLALDKIPSKIKKEDNQKFVSNYLENLN